ncbi:MAG TPA: hypothetical protein VM848_00930 [Acidimicrobiia bacterium]|nr:hypothetical protein [Acidimicrobiia bacterium]
MTYDPRTGMSTERDREVIVTPSGPNHGGMALAAVLLVLAILFVVWLFGSGDGATATTTDLDNPVVTTAPIETTAPVETTAPADTTPTTVAP